MTLDDLKVLAKQKPGLRGPELYEWGSYIERGGPITPLQFLCREDEATPVPQNRPGGQGAENAADFGSLIEAVELGDDK